MSNENINRSNIPPWFFWGLAFPLFVLNIWVFVFLFNTFQGIFSSFILAGFLSVLLNHPIRFFKKRFELSHGQAIFLVFLSFILVFLTLGLIIIPILVIKFSELVQILPDWIESATIQINNLNEWGNNSHLIDRIIVDLTENVESQIQTFIQAMPSFLFGTLGNILNILFIFILTIFFLFFGDSFLQNSLNFWFPSEVGETVKRILYRNFNSYLLNQLILATVLTVTIIPTLFLLKVPFPLLFGLTIGTLGFIPFGAIVSILGVSFVLCLSNFWTGLSVLVVLTVIDQIIENTLPPRLLGKLTGLNPITILFSVTVGATLGNFIGLITAVPIAATIKSLITTFYQPKSEQVEQLEQLIEIP